MATKCFSVVRGKRVRVTRLDECGAPVEHLCGFVVSKGFVSVSFTAEIEDADEIMLKNANGEICILDVTCPSFKYYTMEIEFCDVDPDMLSLMSGMDIVKDWDGNSVGFQVDDKVACREGFALELWSGVSGQECRPGRRKYGYFLLPWIVNGVLGNFTIENDATTFTLSGRSKKGNSWGQGPYDVVATDGTTGVGPLLSPLPPEKHLHTQLTTVAPPEVVCGCQPLGNPPDYVAPEAPTNLTATGEDSRVLLDWDTSPEPSVSGYAVVRSTSADVETSGTIIATPSTSHYIDNSAVNGTTYYYLVRAVDAIGMSDPSNVADATPMAPLPDAPTNLIASPGNEEVTLNWDDSPAADLVEYEVFRSTSANVDTSLAPYATSATSDYLDSNVNNGTTYYYVVRAVGSSGPGADSNEVSAMPEAEPPPSAPTNLIATPGDEIVSLDWSNNPEPDVTGYEVYRGTSAGVDTSGSPLATVASSMFDDVSVVNGTTYYYVVKALGDGGASTASNEASARPLPPPPAAVTDLTATGGDGEVFLEWSDSPEADVEGYDVLRDTSPISGATIDEPTTVASVIASPTASEYIDSDVTNGTTYYYVVRPRTALQTGPLSNEASATPEGADEPPAAPLNLTATPGTSNVNLNWDDSPETDVTGYEVFRSLTSPVDISGTPLAEIAGRTNSDYNDITAEVGTDYFYVVRAVDAIQAGPVSNEVSASPVDQPPAAPLNLVATPGDSRVTLDWDEVPEGDVIGYEVFRSLTSPVDTEPLDERIGLEWEVQTAAADNAWQSVAWSPELGLFVAVAYSGTGNRVMTSSDGITWTLRTSAVDAIWRSVCWSSELGLFVAVANSGTDRVMTSPDGVTWTSQTAASPEGWMSVCWSPELSLFVAVATYAAAMTSPDGVNWTLVSLSNSNGWNSVTWSPELGLFVAVAYSGNEDRIITSPDGTNWTTRQDPVVASWESVCWSSELGLFVAVASNTSTSNNLIMTSPDGINWTDRTSPTDNNWSSVCWSPETGLFVAVAITGTGDRVMTSPDGINWTSRNTPADEEWQSVVWSSELSRFVAVAMTGIGDRVMISPPTTPA